MIEITILHQNFTLLSDRAVFWKNTDTLILADVHLGKSGHFRKSGIAAPQQVNETNLSRMGWLIKSFAADRLLILGDLFHSKANKEWFRFEEWRESYSSLDCHLISGNHDILHSSFYESAHLKTHSAFEESGFRFLHHPPKNPAGDSFIFCGHIHPGVKLTGRGRQNIQLPCFYQKSNQMILPAFGEFTGLHLLDQKKAEKVYAIAGDSVITLRKV
jgi:uncharacterized protein